MNTFNTSIDVDAHLYLDCRKVGAWLLTSVTWTRTATTAERTGFPWSRAVTTRCTVG